MFLPPLLLILYPFYVHWRHRSTDKTITAFMIGFSVFYGIFQFPLENNVSLHSEAYVHYIKPLMNGELPIFESQKHNMPSFKFIMVLMEHFFGVGYVVTVVAARSLFLFIFLLLIRKTLEGLKLQKHCIFIGIAMLMFDWNFNFLLVGDQFRQCVGSLFFFQSILLLQKRKYSEALFFSLVAILGHKMFLLLGIATVAFFYIAERINFIKNRYFFLLTSLSIIPFSLLLKLVLNKMNKMNLDFFDLAHRIHLYHTPLGFEEAFLNKPGVILATLVYLSYITLGFIKFDKFKENAFARSCFLLFICFFILSKLDILGIQFAEPNRLYMIALPFFTIAAAYMLNFVPQKFALFTCALFAAVNFSFKNFSKGSYSPTLKAFQQNPNEALNVLLNYSHFLGLIFLLLMVALIYYIQQKNIRPLTQPTILFLLLISITLYFLSDHFQFMGIIPVFLLYFVIHRSRNQLEIQSLLYTLAVVMIFGFLSFQFTYAYTVGKVDFENFSQLSLNLFVTTIAIMVGTSVSLLRHSRKD